MPLTETMAFYDGLQMSLVQKSYVKLVKELRGRT